MLIDRNELMRKATEYVPSGDGHTLSSAHCLHSPMSRVTSGTVSLRDWRERCRGLKMTTEAPKPQVRRVRLFERGVVVQRSSTSSVVPSARPTTKGARSLATMEVRACEQVPDPALRGAGFRPVFGCDGTDDAGRVVLGRVAVVVVVVIRHDHKRNVPHSRAAERARVLRPTSAGGPLTFKQFG